MTILFICLAIAIIAIVYVIAISIKYAYDEGFSRGYFKARFEEQDRMLAKLKEHIDAYEILKKRGY